MPVVFVNITRAGEIVRARFAPVIGARSSSLAHRFDAINDDNCAFLSRKYVSSPECHFHAGRTRVPRNPARRSGETRG